MVSFPGPHFQTISDLRLGYDSPRQAANVLEASPQPAGQWSSSPEPAGQWNSSPLHRPQQLPPHQMKPRKTCLKPPRSFYPPAPYDNTPDNNTPNNKHTHFAPFPRCLVTGTTYPSQHPHDGEAWRRQQADKIEATARDRQALSGAHEYRGDVLHDPWADQGWEPLGLGEDTPMEGVSAEMDAEVAQWMAYEARLEEQHAVAERHRFAVQEETRRLHGAEPSLGTRPLVRLRLEQMGMVRLEAMML